MSVPRLVLAAGLAIFLAWDCGTSAAMAQTPAPYPQKSIRVVVPFAPGGTADILARIVVQGANEIPSWQFYVENISGAGGNVGIQAAARAAPDGYTLLLCNVACAANQFLVENPNFDPKTALAPVVVVGNVPNILVVGSSAPGKSLREFLAVAKARAGTLTMASSGPGSSSYLTAELLKAKAGVEILDVPYRGSGAAMPDILAGRVDAMVMGVPESLPFVHDGKLLPLGVTSHERVPALPNVPTIAEAGLPGYAFIGWLALFVPAGTPTEIIASLNAVLNTAIRSARVSQRFAEQSIQPAGGKPELAGQYLVDDVELWGNLLRSKRLK